jgi:hypothetical protein
MSPGPPASRGPPERRWPPPHLPGRPFKRKRISDSPSLSRHVAIDRPSERRTPDGQRDLVGVGVGAFALYNLALSLFMVVAPGAFFELIGPFGERNDHYTRDNATFGLALGVAALIAIRVRSWRLPVLAVLGVQFSLHAVNHLVDISAAQPQVVGPIDFALLTLGAILAVLMAVWAHREQRRG